MSMILLLDFIEKEANVHTYNKRGHWKPQITTQKHVKMMEQIQRQEWTAKYQIVIV